MDFIQRIVIDGPVKDVKRLERGLVRTETRLRRRKHVTQRVPFSFAALYELLGWAEEPPHDPYDLAEFRRRPTDLGYAEKRYTFQTYNVTAVQFLTPLSRIFQTLTFRVGLMCQGQVEHYLIRRGRKRTHIVPGARMERQYRSAAKQHGISYDELIEDLYLMSEAEWDVFNATFNYWNNVAPRRRLPKRPQSWDAAAVVRGD